MVLVDECHILVVLTFQINPKVSNSCLMCILRHDLKSYVYIGTFLNLSWDFWHKFIHLKYLALTWMVHHVASFTNLCCFSVHFWCVFSTYASVEISFKPEPLEERQGQTLRCKVPMPLLVYYWWYTRGIESKGVFLEGVLAIPHVWIFLIEPQQHFVCTQYTEP